MIKISYLILVMVSHLSISMLHAAVDYPDYQPSIDKMIQNCNSFNNTTLETTNPSNAVVPTSYISCFTQSMVSEMRLMPQYRELILESALRANSEHIQAIVAASIEAGMAPLVTIMRGMEIYPKNGEEIRNGAMNAGVDPIVATEATSGLEN